MVLNRTQAGEIVTGDAVINQRLDMLLLTVKGSVLGDPNKGLRDDLHDMPFSELLGALIKELNIQVALYLPNINIDKVSITKESDGAVVHLLWSYKVGAGGGELRRTI